MFCMFSDIELFNPRIVADIPGHSFGFHSDFDIAVLTVTDICSNFPFFYFFHFVQILLPFDIEFVDAFFVIFGLPYHPVLLIAQTLV
jgi:hypothetical protein